MSQPYLGEIEIFGFGFAPKGWATCAGQTLPINQNQALFSLLGTTYGGNGTTTFMLPDLRGRLAMGQGNGQGLTPRVIGEVGGETNHTLLVTETPAHNHVLNVIQNIGTGDVNAPGPTVVLSQTTGRTPSGPLTVNLYAADTSPNQPMAAAAVGTTGGQPHPNLMPYNALNFCIALSGVYPSRN
jgi:microcystin-dependent protein